jgi:hypothetical protein
MWADSPLHSDKALSQQGIRFDFAPLGSSDSSFDHVDRRSLARLSCARDALLSREVDALPDTKFHSFAASVNRS